MPLIRLTSLQIFRAASHAGFAQSLRRRKRLPAPKNSTCDIQRGAQLLAAQLTAPQVTLSHSQLQSWGCHFREKQPVCCAARCAKLCSRLCSQLCKPAVQPFVYTDGASARKKKLVTCLLDVRKTKSFLPLVARSSDSFVLFRRKAVDPSTFTGVRSGSAPTSWQN